jgi:hypothetical protein
MMPSLMEGAFQDWRLRMAMQMRVIASQRGSGQVQLKKNLSEVTTATGSQLRAENQSRDCHTVHR